MANYQRDRQDRFVDVYQSSIVPVPPGETPADWTRSITLSQAQQWLKQDLERSEAFRAAWEEARMWFVRKYGRQPMPNHPGDDPLMILIVYTMNSFYQTLNAECIRMGCSKQGWDSFPFKGCWCMLQYAIQTLPPSPAGVAPGANIKCYRGVRFDVTPQLHGRQHVAFSHFASTTTSMAVAMNFAGGSGGSIFEIESVPPRALGIKQYSLIPNEDEVLIFPWSKFEIKNIIKTGNGPTRILLVPYY